MQTATPAGAPDPIPLQDLALRLFQRVTRAGLEVAKIEPQASSAEATITLKSSSRVSDETIRQLSDSLAQETGWGLRFTYEPGPLPEPEVIDAEVIEAEVIDSAPVKPLAGETEQLSNALARRDPPASFGLVPLSYASSTLSLIRTGDSQDLASHLLDDSTLLTALAGVPPYKIRGEKALESVQGDIIALQNVHPTSAAGAAAGNLRWAVTELARRQGDNEGSTRTAGYIGSVASMLLTALGSVQEAGDRAVFQKPYLDLLQSIDRPLSDAVRKLVDPQSAGAREGFQTLFTRLISVAQFAEVALARAAENRREGDAPLLPPEAQQAFLVGSLILRQVLYTFRDPARENLVPVIAERFAEELKSILVDQDPRSRGLLLVLSGCKDITMDLFQAVLTRYVGEREERRGEKLDKPAFGRAPDSTMRGDAVECILGAACLMSPGDDGFFGDLDSRFDHAHPAVKAKFLQAMKFGLGPDELRKELFLDRTLALLDEQGSTVKHEARMEARDLLRHFPAELTSRLVGNECETFRTCRPENRDLLLGEVLLPTAISGRHQGATRADILPLIQTEIETQGTKALTLTVLRQYFSDDFVRALSERDAAQLRRTLMIRLPEIENREAEKEGMRILGAFGFRSIKEAFALAAEKRATDPALAQRLLLASAELSSRFDSADESAKQLIRSFTLSSVVPVFVAQISGKREAAVHMRQVSGQLEQTREELSAARVELARLSPIVNLIREHPGYQRATGDGLVEQTSQGAKPRLGSLQTLQNTIDAAEVRGDTAAKAEAEAQREEVLNRTFPRVPKLPHWPEQLTTVPLRNLLEIIKRRDEVDAKAKSLQAKLTGLEGGGDVFKDDVAEDGKKVWAGTAQGQKGKQEAEFRTQAQQAALQGRILRLFLSSPAIDAETAQKAYDQLPAHETSGALARFALAQRFTIVDSVTMSEAKEADEADALRQVFIAELGVDIGPGEEAQQLEAAARSYNPEQVFCDHFSAMMQMPGLDEEMRGLTRAVMELAEAGIYVPRRPSDHPLLSAMLARLKRERDSGFGSTPSDAWSSDANADTLLTLLHALNHLEPSEKGPLDKEFRAIASGWLSLWQPPRDLPMLPSGTMLSAIENYLANPANDGRRRTMVALQFGKRCLENIDKLPQSQRRSYLRSLEVAEQSIPEEIRTKQVTIEVESKGGPVKYTVQPAELFRTALSRLRETMEHESERRAAPAAKPTLRLPFGQRADGGMGLLPPSAPTLPQLEGGKPPPPPAAG